MQLNLIHKDYRLVQHYLIGLFVLVLGCYTGVAWGINHLLEYTEATPNGRLAIVLSGSSYSSMLCCFFMFALIAGNTFAQERQDRSCDFMDALPPDRIQRCISKAIVIAIPLLITVAINLIVVLLAKRIAVEAVLAKRVIPIEAIVDMFLLLFGSIGIAWCVSSMANGTGAPILLGLISPLLIIYAVFVVNYLLGYDARDIALIHQSGRAGLVIGAIGFLIGCLWFIREGRA